MTKVDISVIILTYNEEANIENALRSLEGWVKEIFIIDSFSKDSTLEIAKRYTDKIYQHPFENYSKQFNWALENLPINTKWVMRLDADEIVTNELKEEIINKLDILDKDVTGILVKRRVYFMGKWIKYGGYYPTWLLRIWKYGYGYCEESWMDEHIKLTKGKVVHFENDIIDYNKKDITWWINKHNNYASREVIEILDMKYNFFKGDKVNPNLFGTQPERKRWLKEKYANLPLFIRPFLYFIYRYFLRFGFLDGKEGLVWHFLQGLWYRFLVDVKIMELEKLSKSRNITILDAIESLYKVRLNRKNEE